MPQRRNHRRRPKPNQGHQAKSGPAQSRPMQGIDQKQFVLNDIVPLTIINPTNNIGLLVIISCDVNGYTWQIQETSTGSVVGTGSNPYGVTTGQFATQALMYTKYYTKSVELDLTLSQGGSVFSLSPIVHLLNPNGAIPFVFGAGAGAFQSAIAAPQNTGIHQPYSKQVQMINYAKWLVSNSDRAWRQTLSLSAPGRELYPTDSFTSDPNQNVQLPSMVRAFTVTIPAGTFEAGASSPFLLGIFKVRTTYLFSQRRTNIQDLIDERTERIRKEERNRAFKTVSALTTAGQDLDALEDWSEAECKQQTPRSQPSLKM